MTVVMYVCVALLLAAAVMTMIRLIRGPSVLDRTVAIDTLLAIAICGLGVWVAVSRRSSVVPVILVVALLGFVGSAALARLLGKDTR